MKKSTDDNNGVKAYKAQAAFDSASNFLHTQSGDPEREHFRDVLQAAEKSGMPRDEYMPSGKTLTEQQLKSARHGDAVDNLTDKTKNNIALSICEAALEYGAREPEAISGHVEYAQSKSDPDYNDHFEL
ncbi:MAG: hypothetical protein ACRBCK_10415 [Alphaproteobacteria bacterium]